MALTAITLTATPANLANSIEPTGIRVDGYDPLTQPITRLMATQGRAQWRYTPRHDIADAQDFGFAFPQGMLFFANATNWIEVYFNNNNTWLRFNDGGGVHTIGIASAGRYVAGVTYLMEINYTSTRMHLLVDGVVIGTITQPINFAVIPTIAYWGVDDAGTNQGDATFAAP